MAPERPSLPGARSLVEAGETNPTMFQRSALAMKVVEDLTVKPLVYAQEPVACPLSSDNAVQCHIIRYGRRQFYRYMEAGTMWSLGVGLKQTFPGPCSKKI